MLSGCVRKADIIRVLYHSRYHADINIATRLLLFGEYMPRYMPKYAYYCNT